jgi:hypothetical protein
MLSVIGQLLLKKKLSDHGLVETFGKNLGLSDLLQF